MMLEKYRFFIGILLIYSLFAKCEHAPEVNIVHIPDKAFLDALLANGVDLNGDGVLSHTEAEAAGSLVIPPSGISDLTGLEAFVNLDSLTVTLNPLDGIDLSSLSSLTYLDITHCELSDLDISGNPLLKTLICLRW